MSTICYQPHLFLVVVNSTELKKRVLSTLAITLLVLVACEATLRLTHFAPRFAVQLAGRESTIGILNIELNSQRLFRLLPDPGLGINQRGFRDPDLLQPLAIKSDSSDACRRIAVLGDSIVMGMAVASSQTIAKQLQAFSKQPICGFNFGIQGYGPDQSLRVLEEDVIPNQPDQVVLVLYPENDFSDLIRNRLVLVSDEGELRWNAENIVAQRLPNFRLLMLGRLAFTGHFLRAEYEQDLDEILFHDRGELLSDRTSPAAIDGQRLLRGVLSRFKQQLDRAGIPLLVVVVPGLRAVELAMQEHSGEKDQGGHFANEQLANLVVAELGLSTIDLTPKFLVPNFAAFYDKNDMHLSMIGHQLVAETIAATVHLAQ